MKKILIFLLFLFSLPVFAQLEIIQEGKYPPFEGSETFESRITDRINDYHALTYPLRIGLHYNKAKFLYAEIRIFRDDFDYNIFRRLSHDFAIVDLDAYEALKMFVESFVLYSFLCPRMEYDQEKIFQNIYYVNDISEKCLIIHHVNLYDNENGISPFIYEVSYKEWGKELQTVEVEPLYDQPCAFTTIDKNFVQILLNDYSQK